jgi:hypothetical protein
MSEGIEKLVGVNSDGKDVEAWIGLGVALVDPKQKVIIGANR